MNKQNKIKVLLITGSYPPEKCGVGDYCANLVKNNIIENTGIEYNILANINWDISNYFKIVKKVKSINPDIIHIQFPSNGYKYSWLPQIISIRFKCIVTVHEVSHFHPLRRIYIIPFTFRSQFVFTNEFEYSYLKKRIPCLIKKKNVIPIGSNITSSCLDSQQHKKKYGIVYFGQIRPKKGIEDVICLALKLKKSKSPYSITIAGQITKKNIDYYNNLQRLDGSSFINWLIDLNESKIVSLLKSNLIAYLPFPDGVSERRGSFFAVITCGMTLFTTKGEQTTKEIEQFVTFVNNPDEMLVYLQQHNNQEIINLFNNKKIEISAFLNKYTWSNIVEKHATLYKEFIYENSNRT